jgi:hypothetical protein
MKFFPLNSLLGLAGCGIFYIITPEGHLHREASAQQFKALKPFKSWRFYFPSRHCIINTNWSKDIEWNSF